MIVFYLIGFLLISAGIVILLGITPEVVTNDMMKFISPKQTLRDKAQIAKGRKKSRRITKEILHIKEALEVTGKGKQFTIACAASVVMLVAGCFLAVLLNNYFLIPVFAAAFAMLPFLFARSTIAAYDKHIKEEMETALSIITTSYIRSDDIVGAVNENITYLKPPIREIFQGFVGDATMISADIKDALRKEGCEIITDNTQLTVFGGFAPNSESAQVLSKALGSKTVQSGSVSRGKNDPSQSLQMIERALLTPDELKSLPKGTFVVMKTGFYPMQVHLKLFFKWGIIFPEKVYTVPDKGNRKVAYARQDILEQEIVKIYATDSRRSVGDPLTEEEREKYPPTQKTLKQQEHSRHKGKNGSKPKGFATGGTTMSESNLTPPEQKEILINEKGEICDESVVGNIR